MAYQYIKVSTQNKIASVKLNRPEKHNALNIDLVRELNHCFTGFIKENEINAVFIFGNDKAFSTGGDLKEIQHLSQPEAEKRSRYVQGTFQLLEQIQVPVVAFIKGFCFGGGLELAMHCDSRICDTSVKMGLPEIKYGMIPGAGGTAKLPVFLKNGDAAFYLLTGKEIPLNKAESCGLIQQLVLDLDDEKERQMDYFSNASRKALIAVKKQVALSSFDLKEAYLQEAAYFSSLLFEQGHTGIEKNFIKNGSDSKKNL